MLFLFLSVCAFFHLPKLKSTFYFVSWSVLQSFIAIMRLPNALVPTLAHLLGVLLFIGKEFNPHALSQHASDIASYFGQAILWHKPLPRHPQHLQLPLGALWDLVRLEQIESIASFMARPRKSGAGPLCSHTTQLAPMAGFFLLLRPSQSSQSTTLLQALQGLRPFSTTKSLRMPPCQTSTRTALVLRL